MEDWRNVRIRHDRGSGREYHCKNGFRTDYRKRRLVPPRCDVGSRLTGTTMEEWWTSLSLALGAKSSRLHEEIMSFRDANALSQEQNGWRDAAFKYVQRAVQNIWPTAEVYVCGSTATGLALPSSDIDLVVYLNPDHTGHHWGSCPDTGPFVHRLYEELSKRPAMFQELTEIPHARVPVLKVKFNSSGLACDISFDGHGNRSAQGVWIVKQFMKEHKLLQPLCLVLKNFLRHQNLNEVFTGGIGSFCLTILVVNHLRKLGSHGAVNDAGALLLSFLARYTCFHNYATDVVSVTPGGPVSKQSRGWLNLQHPDRLSVESPLDPDTDLGYSSYRIGEVRAKFVKAFRLLRHHWDEAIVLEHIFDVLR